MAQDSIMENQNINSENLSAQSMCINERDKGFDYAVRGHYQQALENFDKAIFYDCFSIPGNEARLAKGFLLIKMGRIDDGLKDLQWYLTTEEANENKRQKIINYLEQQSTVTDKVALMHKHFNKPPYFGMHTKSKKGVLGTFVDLTRIFAFLGVLFILFFTAITLGTM